ncbi:MAG: formylglycine-generating enzyme family protein [Spirochaetaceae bacterium]|jgi:formylglycine-generating enzyme required for sulfatase activity|nr:formylglycine-generating enzyme family protein [Spirochaetaceae bacterium]
MFIFFIMLLLATVNIPLGAQVNRMNDEVPAGMVWITGSTFIMGSPVTEPERYSNERTHTVNVDSFYMGIFEITQKEYFALMGTNPSVFKGDDLPVEKVSWYDAIEYCNARSIKEGLIPAYSIDKSRQDPNNKVQNTLDPFKWTVSWDKNANGYRLPTEAEWEYACRAGTNTPFYTGENITTAQANYDGNYPYNGHTQGIYRETTTVVGSFPANQWGLYDMHGNVWEWCWDWYGIFTTSVQTNPTGAATGSGHVLRGGSWQELARDLRSASRTDASPTRRGMYLGFRVVRSR